MENSRLDFDRIPASGDNNNFSYLRNRSVPPSPSYYGNEEPTLRVNRSRSTANVNQRSRTRFCCCKPVAVIGIDDSSDDSTEFSSDSEDTEESLGILAAYPWLRYLLAALLILLLWWLTTAGSCFLGNWNGGSILNTKAGVANLALCSSGATIYSNAKGMSCAPKNRPNDPVVIISGQPAIPGHAFCFEDSAEFVISLQEPAIVYGASYTHLTKSAHPEKHIKSAPLILVFYGIDKDAPGGEFLGSLEYLDNDVATQNIVFKRQFGTRKFPEVKISVHSNHGLHFTCVYRIEIHGHT